MASLRKPSAGKQPLWRLLDRSAKVSLKGSLSLRWALQFHAALMSKTVHGVVKSETNPLSNTTRWPSKASLSLSCGIFYGHLSLAVHSACSILNQKKENESSGTLLRMSWEKPRKDITAVTSVSDRPLTMGFSMRWVWALAMIGEWSRLEVWAWSYVKNTLLSFPELSYSAVQSADYHPLEKVAESAIKEKQAFERLVVSKKSLLEMFAVRIKFSIDIVPSPSFLHRLNMLLFVLLVQQVQNAHNQLQNSGRNVHYGLPMRTDDRSLRGPSHPQYGIHQSFLSSQSWFQIFWNKKSTPKLDSY